MCNHRFARGFSGGLASRLSGSICSILLLSISGWIQVSAANLPPKVFFLQPSPGEGFSNPTAIDIAAQAEDGDGSVQSVEVLTDLGSLGVIKPNPMSANPVNPFHWIWTNPPAGDHKLLAQATDDQGLTGFSEPIVITVKRDQTSSPATLKFVKPIDGTTLPFPDPVSIEITAVDPNGDIRHVEFFANGVSIGRSDQLTKDAVIPGRPREHFLDWKPAAPGVYQLVATSTDTLGNPVKSNPVSITVGKPTTLAKVQITAPSDGQVFKSSETVVIEATAIDPNSYIAHVDFYNAEQKIGESQIAFFRAPDPGTPIQHHFEWVNPPDGDHALTARATDSQGNSVISPQVHIHVGGNTGTLIVEVTAADPEATELSPFVDAIDPARFSITRTGDLSKEFYAVFSLHGTAERGKDYQDPGNYVRFAPGASEATVNIVPISDDVTEPMETVALQLEDPMPLSSLPAPPTSYRFSGQTRSAAAVIFDRTRPAGGALEFALPDSGGKYQQYETIPLMVVAYHPTSYVGRVDFFADGKLIGTSQPILNKLLIGGLVVHRFDWADAVPGQHVLTALAALPDGTTLATGKIPITVQSLQPAVVVLEINAEDPDATEPNAAGVSDPAVFRISRVGGPKDVDVTVYYKVDGTAQNGVDYAALGEKVILPAGESSVTLVVKPLSDNLVEGDESVAVILEPVICPAIYPTPPWCYQIGAAGAAKAVIHDASVSPPPVSVTLLSPVNGAVFAAGEPVTFDAVAKSSGIVPMGFLEILLDEQALVSSKEPQLSFTRTDVNPGTHVVVARLVDISGKEFRSEAAKILVRQVDEVAFVRRQLPAGYIPGTALTVTLTAQPPAKTSAYALEDQPPQGWNVASISDGGAFDTTTGKVKFGLFTDDTARTLTYKVIPPADAKGSFEFTGTSSLNGKLFPVAGDHLLSMSGDTHPADLSPSDHAISLAELTAYGAAWKTGATWQAGPVPIPLEYLTRAGQIWKNGEKYFYDPSQGAPPLCWTVPTATPVIRVAAARSGIAERQLEWSGGSEQAVLVRIQVTPGLGVSSYALQEQLPIGWTVTTVSNDGYFDAKANCVRWGLFLDGNAREVSYQARPTPLAAGTSLRGWVSYDGSREEIRGAGSTAVAGTGAANARFERIVQGVDGRLHLNLRGPANGVCTIETSSDLEHWTELTPVFLPDGQIEYQAPVDAGATRQFYRTR